MEKNKDNKRIGFLKKIFKRKKLVVFILLVTAGFSLWRYLLAKKDGVSESVGIKKGTVTEELVLSGQINADEYAKLSFPSSGEISWVGVKEGDSVWKGQSLVKLDTTVLNAAFQQAQAALRAAEATVENIHDQVKDHSGDETYAQKDARTTAEAAKDKAYEAYVAAEYNLRHSTIYSPFAGIVTSLAHPFAGVNIIYSETQAEVINPETIYFDVSGDQNDIINISKDQKVNIVLDSIPDENIEGVVDFVGYTPKAGEAGTIYKIKVRILKEKFDLSKFRIGMTGDAKFVTGEKENVLYLPPKFVKSDINGSYVNLGNSKNKVYVKVGLEGEDRVEVTSDKIHEGDAVYD